MPPHRLLIKGKLLGVELRDGKLHVTPLTAITPPEAEKLSQLLDDLQPKVRITELLNDVHRMTGFANCFTDLGSGRPHKDPNVALAAVLADASNLGVEKMADASQGVSYAQLAWAHAWYLSEENYRAALANIINAHSALPLAAAWGAGTTSSSDGQYFRAGRRGGGQGSINAKYGTDPGVLFYTHVSDQYGPFRSKVISATTGEAPHVLDGLMHHGTSLEIKEHYTDTGGANDHVFGLCHLLGFRFAPRLRDIRDRRLGTIERAVAHLRSSGRTVPNDLLAHTSPLGWSHISLTGDYLWEQAAVAVDGFRPLNTARSRLKLVA